MINPSVLRQLLAKMVSPCHLNGNIIAVSKDFDVYNYICVCVCRPAALHLSICGLNSCVFCG